MKKASHHSSREEKLAEFYKIDDSSNDITFNYNGTVAKNGDITMVVSAKNNSRETRHVKVNMYGMAKYYNGVVGSEVAKHSDDMTVQPGKCK